MYDLKKLKSDTEWVCRMAEQAKGRFKDAAVNWADFHCIDAQRCIDTNGSESYRVLIEEASPENAEVYRFIEHELGLMGYKDVDVEFEW